VEDFVVGRRAAPDALLRSARVFVPISLGNHYYNSKTLQRILTGFLVKASSSVIFLCDRLRYLSYLIRGESNNDRVGRNIQVQLEQTTRALTNLGLGSLANVTIANWSMLEDDPRYGTLLVSVEALLRDVPAVRHEAEVQAAHLLRRFGDQGKLARKERLKLQLQYITEETALSLYMTEIRGFNVELYRRGMGFVDYLYAQHPDALRSSTGKQVLSRKFISLEEWF
jgi:tRNA-dependent cyclodipeptide synthase